MTEATTPDPQLNRAGRRAQGRTRRAGAVMATIPAAFGTTALLLGATAVPAGAGTIEVQNLDESGPGSLRAALAAANDGDVITFAAGLTGTIELTGAELEVEDGVTIQGPGAGVITVDGNDQSRIFDVDGGNTKALAVVISGLTLTHGSAAAGGAIQANGGDHLTLDGVVISYSRSTGQGGAFINVIEDTSITIVDSEISGNVSAAAGGGLYTQGAIEIRNSVISGNTAGGHGGGVYLDSNDANTNTVTIVGSTISDNSSTGNGGGLWVGEAGGVTILDSTISGNDAVESGGGLYVEDLTGPFSMQSSTVSGNTAGDWGGGLAIYYAESVSIVASTVSDNIADDGGGLFVLEANGAVTVANTTVSGNTARLDGGGIAFYGVAELELLNSTITANSAQTTGGVLFVDDFEKSLDSAATSGRPDKVDVAEERVHGAGTGPHTVVGTIVWGNAAGDLGGWNPVTFASTSSLLGTTDANATVTDLGGTLTGQDPRLGPLQDNGGPTLTHALLDGSPAINAGPDPVADFPGNTDDQRGPGYPRVIGGRVDIGAFEVQPTNIEPNFTG